MKFAEVIALEGEVVRVSLKESRRARGAFWTLVTAIAAVSLTSSGVVYKLSTPGGTRVLGQQFTTSGSSTAANNGCGNGNSGSSGAKDCSNPGHAITVTGEVIGSVSPGTSAVLRLTFGNTNNQDLVLQSAGGSVGTPSKSGCLSTWFHVAPYAGPTVTIKKNSSNTTVDLSFAMDNKPFDQDACKSARIPLSFSATAAGA